MKEINYKFIKNGHTDVLDYSVDKVLYFVNCGGGILRNDKAEIVALKIFENEDIETCGLRVSFYLNKCINLYNEISELDFNFYKIVFFNGAAKKIFVISGDALEILVIFLKNAIINETYLESDDLIMDAILSIDEILGVDIINISEFE